ncbi:bromodomain containing protein 8 [Echinococcus multilocularis]|uniref:Bromodomain containing protein 8 n=1 Tax=Echinococcus multilocularis TaxID=6211 RepID=A0A087VZ40_ECHMU|nr:bromodomain containing protein 8 [Echinococcus multilocularis]
MPYGRPVSRRRRRRFQGTDPASVMVAAKCETNEMAPRASTGSETSASPHDAHRHHHRQRAVSSATMVPVAVPSPELLRAGHKAGVWPLRERLILASALLDTDNQQLTWPPISRRLAKFTPPASCGFVRPPTWCSARACAKQYSLLLDSAEMFRKQQVDVERSAEEGRVVFQAPSDVAAATATVGLSLAEFIVKRLTVERVEELRSQIISARHKYRLFKEMLAKVESGELDNCMDILWASIQCQHEDHSTSGSAELAVDTPPEVAEFVRELNSWTDPFDVPHSVWTVSGGSGAALRSVPSIAKVTTPKKMPLVASKPKSPPERRPSDSSRNSTAEAAEGEGECDASGERTSTPSTSVMSESDLDYGEDALKAESIDSGRLEEKEEEESTIPLSSRGGSPKTQPKVTNSPDFQSSPTAALFPPRLDEETSEEWKEPKAEGDIQEEENIHEEEKKREAEKEGSFQPRSLRLRLSRQDDGNLSVVPETTSSSAAVAPTPPTSPLRLRLSLVPPKVMRDQWPVEILEEAFPDIKIEQFHSPRKRLRSSGRITDTDLYEATKSILTAAEKRTCAVASGEKLTQRKKVFVHSVLSQLAGAVYTTPASSLQQDGVVISVDVARAVYARITSILQRFTIESSLKIEKSAKSGSRRSSRKK